jgi:RHS repeat-associated protein
MSTLVPSSDRAGPERRCAWRWFRPGTIRRWGVGARHPAVVPVNNWRGRAVDGICVSGSAFCATDFPWPARAQNAPMDDPPVTDPVYGGPVAWGGSLLDTQKDGSGLVYKRNRYYDPASGRFTQVDPIGLGGGLNAYGFGGGDQVSFSDPFGLCPPKDTNVSDCNNKTTLGRAWVALDGSGARGKEVIAGIVKGGFSVSTAKVIKDACGPGTNHGCINMATRAISLNDADNAGTMATTLAHEYKHTQQKKATTAVQSADNEQAAWDYASKVYDDLQEPYSSEAQAEVGADFTSERPTNPDRKANWNRWVQDAHAIDGLP